MISSPRITAGSRLRAMAYNTSKALDMISAGPRSLCKEEKEQREAGTDENGQHIAKRREGNAPQDKRKSVVLFFEFAQQFPSVSKVASQKEHQENLNDFDRLKAEEIDLGVAGAGTGAQKHKNHRKHKTQKQRHKTEFGEQALVVQKTQSQHEGTAQHHSLSKRNQAESVPQRISKTDHGDQAQTRQHMDQRQQKRISAQSLDLPDPVQNVEASQVQNHMDPEA